MKLGTSRRRTRTQHPAHTTPAPRSSRCGSSLRCSSRRSGPSGTGGPLAPGTRPANTSPSGKRRGSLCRLSSCRMQSTPRALCNWRGSGPRVNPSPGYCPTSPSTWSTSNKCRRGRRHRLLPVPEIDRTLWVEPLACTCTEMAGKDDGDTSGWGH